MYTYSSACLNLYVDICQSANIQVDNFPCYAGIYLFPLPSNSCPHMTLYWLLMRDITNKGLTVVC